MRFPQVPERWRRRRFMPALAVVGAALLISLILINRSSDARFDPTVRTNPVVDLLGWLPATDQSRRGYAAWVEQPGAPLDLTTALDRLSICPRRWLSAAATNGSARPASRLRKLPAGPRRRVRALRS